MKLPFPNRSSITFTALRRTNLASKFIYVSPNPQFTKRLYLISLCTSNNRPNTTTNQYSRDGRSDTMSNSISINNENGNQWKSETRNPDVPPFVPSWVSCLSPREHAFLLLAFMASMTSMAFISLVAAAVPTLYAMRRAAISFAELVDTAHLELPNTMAAIRLSSTEISDLTLELNDLKQDISEAGAKHTGAIAHRRTISTVHETENLSSIALPPVVSSGRKKTSCANVKATSAAACIISRGGLNP